MDSQQLSIWLDHSISKSNKHAYTHRLLKEKPEQRNLILEHLQKYIEKAHADAIRHLRRPAEISLDPLAKPRFDPAIGYPEKLPMKTLKGYLGEVLAGIIAESFIHFDQDGWKVPAYSFRFHQVAFDYIDTIREGGETPSDIPGRTGDDTLAFLRRSDGSIKKALVCESKCITKYRPEKCAEAHKKVSQSGTKPIEIRRLLEIFRDYEDPESKDWKEALYSLFFEDVSGDYERCDLVSYVCGKSPVSRQTWIDSDVPHPEYRVKRQLETVELHISDLDEFVKLIYGVKDSSCDDKTDD